MDVETPSRGRDGSGVFTEKSGGRSTRDNLASLNPRGSFPFHHDVGLGRPMPSLRSPMMSPIILDTLDAVVCQGL
jgi:hypothetical protein